MREITILKYRAGPERLAMSIIINIKPEAEAELTRQAKVHGVRPEAYAATLLEEAVHNGAAKKLTSDQLERTLLELAQFSYQIQLLPDSRETHERWRALIVQYGVQGVQVHDARIAASMYVHGVGQLLTINVRDFKRFDNLRVTNPADVPPTKAKP